MCPQTSTAIAGPERLAVIAGEDRLLGDTTMPSLPCRGVARGLQRWHV